MSDGDFATADVVIALKEAEHRPLMVERHPTWVEKVSFWKALKDFDEAVRLDATSPKPLDNGAWRRATCEDGEYRDGNRAVKDGTRACELTKWADTHLIVTLAAACAENGQFDEAVKW